MSPWTNRYTTAIIGAGQTQPIPASSSLRSSPPLPLDRVRAIFPNVQVGDIEPVGGVGSDANGASWLQQLQQWSTDFQANYGQPLSFFHADVIQSSPSWQQDLEQTAQLFKIQSTTFGVIVDGQRQSNVAWTSSALVTAAEVEADPLIRPADLIVQTWDAYPTALLPETQNGTLTNLVNQVVNTTASVGTIDASATYSPEGVLTDVDCSDGSTAVITATSITISLNGTSQCPFGKVLSHLNHL